MSTWTWTLRAVGGAVGAAFTSARGTSLRTARLPCSRDRQEPLPGDIRELPAAFLVPARLDAVDEALDLAPPADRRPGRPALARAVPPPLLVGNWFSQPEQPPGAEEATQRPPARRARAAPARTSPAPSAGRRRRARPCPRHYTFQSPPFGPKRDTVPFVPFNSRKIQPTSDLDLTSARMSAHSGTRGTRGGTMGRAGFQSARPFFFLERRCALTICGRPSSTSTAPPPTARGKSPRCIRRASHPA